MLQASSERHRARHEHCILVIPGTSGTATEDGLLLIYPWSLVGEVFRSTVEPFAFLWSYVGVRESAHIQERLLWGKFQQRIRRSGVLRTPLRKCSSTPAIGVPIIDITKISRWLLHDPLQPTLPRRSCQGLRCCAISFVALRNWVFPFVPYFG